MLLQPNSADTMQTTFFQSPQQWYGIKLPPVAEMMLFKLQLSFQLLICVKCALAASLQQCFS